MTTTTPECPVCRVRMEEGHVLDAGNSNHLLRVSWTEGQPEKGLMGYRVKGRRRLPTITWRCPRCGWLLWFAREEQT
ncbi:MAG TPA: hypothetical protein VFH83_14800 [Spirochaetia bacterium]|nr:hypothetical protein [Spirochaetia bacterium]